MRVQYLRQQKRIGLSNILLMKKINFDFVLKWGSTLLLIVGSILSSLNIYPLNVVFSFVGNCGWMWAGFRMKEPSLWVVSLFLLIVYMCGTAFHYLR